MSHEPVEPESIVAELQAFITRAKQALSEARRPDLAERCMLLLREDGRCSLCFFDPSSLERDDYDDAEEILQFLRIDSDFEFSGEAGNQTNQQTNKQGDKQ